MTRYFRFSRGVLTGLDSFMAEAVVTKLGLLAAAGRTIVATIHQPSSQVRFFAPFGPA